MGPRYSYLSPAETRKTVRGTELQKQKARITVVLCVNADGSHNIPVRYIGHSSKPRCLSDERFEYLTENCSSQPNAWVDNKFQKWITWWYSEVRKVTLYDILLITDNCRGHKCDMDLPGLRIEFLPPNTTALYQPLDLGLISHSKIRYHSLLLRQIVENTLLGACGIGQFPKNSNHGFRRLREGQMPHVGDAMSIFNKTWQYTTQRTTLKCWLMSKCLSDTQVREGNNLLQTVDASGDVDAEKNCGGLQCCRYYLSTSIRNYCHSVCI